MNEPKDHWTMNDQVFIHYGGGWGLSPNLRTVYLGKEEELRTENSTGVKPIKVARTPLKRRRIRFQGHKY